MEITEIEIRPVGVSVSNLVKLEQLPLFKEVQRRRELIQAIDSINDRYREFTVTRGMLLEPSSSPGIIFPAWRPYGIKKMEY